VKLFFSESAVADLKRLRKFIAQHNPAAAQRIARKLMGTAEGLMLSPQKGRPVPDLPGEIRELIFGKYIVRYEVRKDSLYVIRVWHGREDRGERK